LENKRPPPLHFQQNSKVRTLRKFNFGTNFLIDSLNMKITQYSAAVHTADSVSVLEEVLDGQVLGEWLWHVHLPSLNPYDFYLWNKVYVNNPFYHKKCKTSSRRKFRVCHVPRKVFSRSEACIEAEGTLL
jgi:hypothetical protein